MARCERCDAIILDINMPKIDGLSLISQIREKYPDLPIVMFTGLGYDEEAMQIARKAVRTDTSAKGSVQARFIRR